MAPASLNFGKKRGAYEIVEEVDELKTKKRQKIDRDLFVSCQCLTLLRTIRDHRSGKVFDEVGVKNRGYFSVISKPMDFVTIKSKLEKNLYRNPVDEFPEDVRLVFSNAMRYYPRENSVYKVAKKLKEVFEIRWESLKKKLNVEVSRAEVDRPKQSKPERSSKASSLSQKVSLLSNPVKEKRKSDQESKPERSSKTSCLGQKVSLLSNTVKEERKSDQERKPERSSKASSLSQKVSVLSNPVKEERKSDQERKPERSSKASSLSQKVSVLSNPVKEKRKSDQESKPETSSLSQKVSLLPNPVKEQIKSGQEAKAFVETPEKALRAATIKIKFADTIVKARFSKLLDQSSNKADVMMRMKKEKQLLETRQLEEKARIEAEIKAPRLKLRESCLLAVKKIEEEASRSKIEDPLAAEKEFVMLCGGSDKTGREWVEGFGLFLRRDEEIEEEACDDHEEGEIF